jgi:hypothetical protein
MAMKYECDLIQDLIPLVKDGIASEKSNTAVKLHLKECATCREVYETNTKAVLTSLPERSRKEISQVTLYKDRIKKRRKIIISLAVLFAVILMIGTGLATATFMVKLFKGDSYITRDIAEYGNYSRHMEFEQEGMFGLLEIFPKELPPSATVKDFYYFCNNGGLFDNSYQLYLVCAYGEDDFTQEKERLLSIEIAFRDEVHKPIVTDEGFGYPAIITIFGYKESFEYALLDETTRTIVYVFVQSMGIDKSIVPSEYRPQGFRIPTEELNEFGNYLMYSFKIDDGIFGHSYVTPGKDHIE